MRTLIRLTLLAVLCLGFVQSPPCAAQEGDPSVLTGTWVLNGKQMDVVEYLAFDAKHEAVINILVLSGDAGGLKVGSDIMASFVVKSGASPTISPK